MMRALWLANLLRLRLLRLAERREPDFCVIRGDNAAVYLRRWWLIPRNNIFNIYLHNMLGDDDGVLHDHPYVSLSLVLTDGLVENFVLRPDKMWGLAADANGLVPERLIMEQLGESRVLSAGDLVWRSSRMCHQLVVLKPAWTLFITGLRIKDWGFWCPKGWRHWKQYIDITQDPSVRGGHKATSKVGIGCGEQS